MEELIIITERERHVNEVKVIWRL